MAMLDSMGDPLHNVMHSMGTDSVMGWNADTDPVVVNMVFKPRYKIAW